MNNRVFRLVVAVLVVSSSFGLTHEPAAARSERVASATNFAFYLDTNGDFVASDAASGDVLWTYAPSPNAIQWWQEDASAVYLATGRCEVDSPPLPFNACRLLGTLLALDKASGAPLWVQDLGGRGSVPTLIDGQLIVVVQVGHLLDVLPGLYATADVRSFTAINGVERWRRTFPGSWSGTGQALFNGIASINEHQVSVTVVQNPVQIPSPPVTFKLETSSGVIDAPLQYVTPSISVASSSIVEGNTGSNRSIQFAITLSAPSANPITVDYAVESIEGINAADAGTDFIARTGKATFKPNAGTGLTSTSKFISAAIRPDLQVEADETFQVRLLNPTGAPVRLGSAIGTILDDDTSIPFGVSVGDGSIVEGSKGANSSLPTTIAKIPVTLGAPATTVLTVDVSVLGVDAIAGGDFKAVPPMTMTFKPGQKQRYIVIRIYPDAYAENDEAIAITLSNPSLGLSVNRSLGTLTILDDD